MRKAMPILLIFLVSCGGQFLELDKARTISENIIISIKEEKFDNFSNNYTDNFFQRITVQQWIDDQNKIKELLGPIGSYRLIEYNIENKIGEPSDIVLDYEVQHTKFKSHHIFTVVLEDGNYKVFGHKIKSDAL